MGRDRSDKAAEVVRARVKTHRFGTSTHALRLTFMCNQCTKGHKAVGALLGTLAVLRRELQDVRLELLGACLALAGAEAA